MASLCDTPRRNSTPRGVKRPNLNESGEKSSSVERYTRTLSLTFSTEGDRRGFDDMLAVVKRLFGQIANRNTETLVRALQFVLQHKRCNEGTCSAVENFPSLSVPQTSVRLPSSIVGNDTGVEQRSEQQKLHTTPSSASSSSQCFQSPSADQADFRSPISTEGDEGNTCQRAVSSAASPAAKKSQSFFACQTDQLQNLVSEVHTHSKNCSKPLRCAASSFSGVVAYLTFECDDSHIVEWSSSATIGECAEANVRCIMAFACSGMLRIQFDKFTKFFSFGHWPSRMFSTIMTKISATISVLSEESVSRALFEEVARTAETTADSHCVRIMTDARHACRKNSRHTDVVAIGQVTRKVVNVQHITKKDDKSTQRHEAIGTVRLYEDFNEKKIKVKLTFISFYSER